MIAPSLPLGIGFHAAGALLAANCYAPQRFIRRWSWEIFWMTQAAWCWLLWPAIGAVVTIPNLRLVLSNAPPSAMVLSFLMGMAYGVGGTAFNVSIRYIGFSLTYCIAVGLSSILGTLVPPLVRGQFAAILAKPGSAWVLAGVAAGAAGIAVIGFAGRLKEQDLDAGLAAEASFSLIKRTTAVAAGRSSVGSVWFRAGGGRAGRRTGGTVWRGDLERECRVPVRQLGCLRHRICLHAMARAQERHARRVPPTRYR